MKVFLYFFFSSKQSGREIWPHQWNGDMRLGLKSTATSTGIDSTEVQLSILYCRYPSGESGESYCSNSGGEREIGFARHKQQLRDDCTAIGGVKWVARTRLQLSVEEIKIILSLVDFSFFFRMVFHLLLVCCNGDMNMHQLQLY